MSFFEKTEDLEKAFGDIASKGFHELRPLQDVKAGFSVTRNYPEGIRYKVALGQSTGNPDSIAVLWVVYANGVIPQKGDDQKVPLRIRVALMSKYRSRHWDYDFDDVEGDCPTPESLEQSLASPQPIEVVFDDEFFYDHSKEAFVDRKGNQLTGVAVLERAFNAHCDSVHLLKGLRLRMELAWQSRVVGILGLVISLIQWVLKHVFGRTIESSRSIAGLYTPYPRSQFKKLNEDSIDLLGYKASKNIVILFCILIVCTSVLRYSLNIKGGYFSSIYEGEFLSLAHAIVGLWVIDVVAPNIFFQLMNVFVYLRKRAMLRKIRVR